jgi:hypothetical protein
MRVGERAFKNGSSRSVYEHWDVVDNLTLLTQLGAL